ncbi:MAG: hypothetical protein HN348_34995 [Proteobacteria bacterium]|nr:hypothetical protein [Pseudomonadota bacterium]
MRTAGLIVVLALLAGCGKSGKIKKLAEAEHVHYYALRVFMDEDAEKAYLKLKTQAERDAWLRENNTPKQKIGDKISYWDMFYQYDDDDRLALAEGEVEIGWKEEQVLMAWGAPYSRRRTTKRTATRSEIFIYRFEVDKNGNVLVWEPGSKATYKAIELYQYDLHVDDGVVTDMQRKEDWD